MTEAESPRPRFSAYPEGCPPTIAVPAVGSVFRITKHDPPIEADFVSLFEMGRVPKDAKKACQSRGLSLYRSIEDARHHIRLFSFHGNFIAAGNLDAESGLMLATPPKDGSRPSHLTWWCFDGVERKSGFQVIEEHDDDQD